MITPPVTHQQAPWFRNYRQLLKGEFLIKWLPVLIAFVFMFGVVMASVWLTFQSQDLRRSASQSAKDVELILVPSSTPLHAQNLSTVFVRLNTHGKKIDGLQVVLDLKSDYLEGVSLKVREPGGMRRAWDQVEGVQDWKKISFALITTDPNQPFSNNYPQDVAELIFTVNEPSTLNLIFDDVLSKAVLHKQGQNVLKPFLVQEYKVEPAPSPSPLPTITSSQESTVGSTASPKAKISTTTSPSSDHSTAKGGLDTDSKTSTTAKVTVTSGAASLGSTENSSGSASLAAVCNQACSYSSECGDGFLCYRQQCRRIGNVTNASCQSQEDTEAKKVCNEVCTSSSQCQDSLICYQGNCRDASNPESVQCTKKTLNETQVVAQLCNTECVTNAECGDSLSCYQGACRLSSNPTSESCISDANETAGKTQESDQASPSPSPESEEASDLPGVFSQVLKVLLVVGVVVVLGVAGVIGYLWFMDRRTAGL